jgi:uncharacterized protein YbaA (DUF1428 family)
MTYVDGMIIPVPKKKLAAYRAMSKKFGRSVASMVRWNTAKTSPTTSRSASGRHFRAA